MKKLFQRFPVPWNDLIGLIIILGSTWLFLCEECGIELKRAIYYNLIHYNPKKKSSADNFAKKRQEQMY